MDSPNPIGSIANVGVPTVLIAFAIFAISKRLSSIATILIGVTVTHFAFVAFWQQMLAMTEDVSPVIGSWSSPH
jgi:hypothetical protein